MIDRALGPFAKMLHELNLSVWEQPAGFQTWFPMHGARKALDPPDVPGTPCLLNVTIDDTRTVVTSECYLPDPIPSKRRMHVTRAMMEINQSSMLGSWDMHPDSGEARFRAWIYLSNHEIPEWSVQAVLALIMDGASAADVCNAAYRRTGQQ